MIRMLFSLVCVFGILTGSLHAFTEEELMDIDGRKVFVKISGRSKDNPYAFFLHYGPGGNTYYFEQTVGKDLEKQVTLVYIDFYGAGRSPHSDGMAVHTKKGLESFSTDRYIADILYVADYIGASKFGIIGHDFGAFLGLYCAAKVSDRVLWFAAINPQWDYPRNIRYLATRMRDQFAEKQNKSDPYTEALMVDKVQRVEKIVYDGITEPEHIEQLSGLFRYVSNLYFSDEKTIHKHPVAKKMLKHELFQTTIGQMAFIGCAYNDKYFTKDAVPLLKHLNGKKVLCIVSDSMFVDPLQYERIRRDFPAVMFMEIPGGYYFPMIEKKKETTTILQEFLKHQ